MVRTAREPKGVLLSSHIANGGTRGSGSFNVARGRGAALNAATGRAKPETKRRFMVRASLRPAGNDAVTTGWAATLTVIDHETRRST
jgi:hypothetical protein